MPRNIHTKNQKKKKKIQKQNKHTFRINYRRPQFIQHSSVRSSKTQHTHSQFEMVNWYRLSIGNKLYRYIPPDSWKKKDFVRTTEYSFKYDIKFSWFYVI